MCCRKEESVVGCSELGELERVDFCLHDRHKNYQRWSEQVVVTGARMSRCRSLLRRRKGPPAPASTVPDNNHTDLQTATGQVHAQ